MKLYMDESGNGNPSDPLIVGAVETDDDSEEIERRIQELYGRLSARRNLVGFPSFEDFRRNGFHASADPPEISVPFLELMQGLSFKAYIYFTDRTSTHAGVTEVEKLGFMYECLLGDLLLRHRSKSELLCYIEQNDSLKHLLRVLPDNATRRACEKAGRTVPLPRLDVVSAAKTEAMSIAIIDYIMMAVSRWIRCDYTEDPQKREYRGFRGIEPFISVLYSLERGRIASRKVPLH